jgi:hypothetical protein
MEFENKFVIAASGFARSGKSTVCSLLKEKIELETAKKVKIFSFARQLKADVNEFCLEKIGVSAFTEDIADKENIRPLLVWYGNLKRKTSNGQHWVKKIKSEISTFFLQGGDVAIISDLRFKEFDLDEVDFVKSYKNNYTISISKIGGDSAQANESERKNIPIVESYSDFKIRWDQKTESKNLRAESAAVIESLILKIK